MASFIFHNVLNACFLPAKKSLSRAVGIQCTQSGFATKCTVPAEERPHGEEKWPGKGLPKTGKREIPLRPLVPDLGQGHAEPG